MEIYIVKAGDTVFSIAALFGVSAARIITDNGLDGSGRVAVGQALLIMLPEVVHTVAAGENLYSIAALYGTTVGELQRNNPFLITEPFLSLGQKLAVSYYGEKSLGSIITSGFVYASVRRSVLERALPYMTYLLIFGYGFLSSGGLITVNDAEIIALAGQYGTSVILSLSLIEPDGSFNTGKLSLLLTDIDFQNAVIDGMIGEALSRGAVGVDIDMEYIPAVYKEEFAAFIRNFSERLHNSGLILHIDLAPKTSADQSGTLYEAHDYSVLGAAADYVFLMTYEWGYMFGPPMAVAPIDKVTAVLDYAVTEIPLEKITLGIPNYAYDWALPFEQGVTAARVIGNLYAAELASDSGAEIRFDETAQTPFYSYTSDGTEHIVWFEDVRSMSAKFKLVNSRGIAGCGFWNLMRAFPQGFLLLNYLYSITKNL